MGGATKSHILDLIENYCIDKDIINELEENPTAEMAEVLKLKLEFEREEAQKAREAAEAEAQKAREAARELRLSELKKARELRELELKSRARKA